MPSKKSSASSSKKSTGKGTAESEEVVMWVRLPRPMSAKELSKLGLKGDVCFSGDTCIAATNMRNDVDIVVQMAPAEALRRAQLTKIKDPCFGGDTCIV
jgi:hypothetical protein